LILCIYSILLMRLYVVWVRSMNVLEVVISLFLAVHETGCSVRHICRESYSLPLKTVVRNYSFWVDESRLQRALILCIREARTDCVFAGW